MATIKISSLFDLRGNSAVEQRVRFGFEPEGRCGHCLSGPCFHGNRYGFTMFSVAFEVGQASVAGWSEFENENHACYMVTQEELGMLRLGELVLFDEGSHSAVFPYDVGTIHISKDIPESRVLEIVKAIKERKLHDRAEVAEKKLREAGEKIQALEARARAAEELARRLQADLLDSREEAYSHFRETERLESNIREAAKRIGETRNFVRSKSLAGIREFLEAAITPNPDTDDQQ